MAWAAPRRHLSSWSSMTVPTSCVTGSTRTRRLLSTTTREDRVRASLANHNEALVSSPWIRLLSSPLRRCIVTRKAMPKAMMIQLKTAFFPADQAGSSTAAQPHRPDEDESGQQAFSSAPLSPDLQQLEEFFVPDGILHPKFHKPKHGRAVSLCTSRLCVEAISSYSQKGEHAETESIAQCGRGAFTDSVPFPSSPQPAY